MNENMVHVMKKINEMQMKLNLINENIEEIKNVQKNLEKKKSKIKQHIFKK
jgi:prefoldin subunit 5